MLLGLFAALVVMGGCASDPIAIAPSLAAGDAGVLSFPTAGSLQRAADSRSFTFAKSTLISGELIFPPGSGPFPAVVLAHGCNGNRNVERAWGASLRDWGYATFVIDSFGPRRLTEVCTQLGVLVPLQRVPDAYGALRLLAAHPRIDPQRIALIGFSQSPSILGAVASVSVAGCLKKGATIAGSPAAAAEARRNLRAQLAELLK